MRIKNFIKRGTQLINALMSSKRRVVLPSLTALAMMTTVAAATAHTTPMSPGLMLQALMEDKDIVVEYDTTTGEVYKSYLTLQSHTETSNAEQKTSTQDEFAGTLDIADTSGNIDITDLLGGGPNGYDASQSNTTTVEVTPPQPQAEVDTLVITDCDTGEVVSGAQTSNEQVSRVQASGAPRSYWVNCKLVIPQPKYDFSAYYDYSITDPYERDYAAAWACFRDVYNEPYTWEEVQYATSQYKGTSAVRNIPIDAKIFQKYLGPIEYTSAQRNRKSVTGKEKITTRGRIENSEDISEDYIAGKGKFGKLIRQVRALKLPLCRDMYSSYAMILQYAPALLNESYRAKLAQIAAEQFDDIDGTESYAPFIPLMIVANISSPKSETEYGDGYMSVADLILMAPCLYNSEVYYPKGITKATVFGLYSDTELNTVATFGDFYALFGGFEVVSQLEEKKTGVPDKWTLLLRKTPGMIPHLSYDDIVFVDIAWEENNGKMIKAEHKLYKQGKVSQRTAMGIFEMEERRVLGDELLLDKPIKRSEFIEMMFRSHLSVGFSNGDLSNVLSPSRIYMLGGGEYYNSMADWARGCEESGANRVRKGY